MEPAQMVPEASWSSFNSTMPIEESEIMAQLLGTFHFPATEDDHHDPSFGNPSISWSSDHVSDLYYCLNSVNADTITSSYYWPQGDDDSISTSSFFAPPSGYESCYLGGSNEVPGINASSASMDYCKVVEQLTTPSLQVAPNPPNLDPMSLNDMANSDDMGDSGMNVSESTAPDQMSQPKRRFHAGEDDNPAESPKKKVHRTSKKAQSKRAEKSAKSGDEEESNVVVNRQSSSCCSSEDDLNAPQETNGGGSTSTSSKGSPALNLNGKTRSSRGAATDPQSLYARKRRERINERLRILQNLVPNGTKVDISTMLEEAVQYVKFLQLQIKLLSSDDLWMYAPLAYNGMNIDLNLKISPQQQ